MWGWWTGGDRPGRWISKAICLAVALLQWEDCNSNLVCIGM